MLKKCLSYKINVTKKCTLFPLRVPTHRRFIFNSQLLYELEHMVYLTKTVCEIFHFRFRLVFMKLYIFVQLKAWTL